MADVHITKQAAARRQIDAAIRILFAEEDPLAVHIVVDAARNLLVDLANKNEKQLVFWDDAYSDGLKQLQKHFPAKTLMWNLQKVKSWYGYESRRPANFLKHANDDATKTLNPATLNTDHLLLEACTIYMELGFKPTPEMNAFARWHLAVYPHEEQDPIETAAGFVDRLTRTEKLQFGAFLLEQCMTGDQGSEVGP